MASSSADEQQQSKRACTTRICGVCKHEFPGAHALYEHVELCHVKTWVKGQTCCWDGCTHSGAKRMDDYRVHMRTHTCEKPYECGVCHQRFLQSGTRDRHMLSTHTDERPFVCRRGCDKDFKRSDTRNEHELTHTEEKNYKCMFCDKCSRTAGQRDAHERTHTGDKPYKCQYCDQCFVQSGTRDSHERTHTGERPFKCRFCDQSFAVSSTRDIHERSHTGDKPYKCRFCDKFSATSGQRDVHERIHTGERPYECDVCHQRFSGSGSRERHMLTHTAPKCGYCGVRPLTRDSLMCGVCDNKYSWQYHVKEKTVFSFLSEFDWRLCHFVRDTNVGCGVRRRPDGYLDLVITVGDGHVLFIVEVDEHFHRRNDVKCEFVRLQDILDAHKGSLYVLRYNPDQDGGLEDECLTILAERCLSILDGEYENALKDEHCAMLVEYIGYPEARVELCNRMWFQSQIELMPTPAE